MVAAASLDSCEDCGEVFEPDRDEQDLCDACAIAQVFGDFTKFCGLLEIRVKNGPPKQFGHEGWFREQKLFEEQRTGRDVVLKPRQVGFTTLELARDLWHAIVNPGHQVLVIVHESDAADTLFQTLHIFCDSLRELGLLPETKYSSKREVVFAAPLNSAVRIVEAGATEVSAKKKGRSGTVHRLHATEVAFWGAALETIAAALSCVPVSGEVVIESTANGAGGYFYERVMTAYEGRSRYKLHFYAWFDHAEYRLPANDNDFDATPTDQWEKKLREHGCDDDQIAFWRAEVEDKGLEKALQEYPESVETCFRAAGALWIDPRVIDRLTPFLKEPIREAPIVFKGRSFKPALIYRWPVSGRSYVIGADVSEGVARDGSSATVLDQQTGEMVATWWDDGTPAKEFGIVLGVLGTLYNGAFVAPERNNDGKATLVGLQEVMDYRRVYHDTNDGRAGFNTTTGTRPLVWENLGYALRDGSAVTVDRSTLAELRTVIKDEDGCPRARGKRRKSADASRDDRVVSWGIAWLVRNSGASWQTGQTIQIKGA